MYSKLVNSNPDNVTVATLMSGKGTATTPGARLVLHLRWGTMGPSFWVAILVVGSHVIWGVASREEPTCAPTNPRDPSMQIIPTGA